MANLGANEMRKLRAYVAANPAKVAQLLGALIEDDPKGVRLSRACRGYDDAKEVVAELVKRHDADSAEWAARNLRRGPLD